MKPRIVSVALVHFVDFYHDGNSASDMAGPQEVRNRSRRNLKIPADAFAFVFYDVLKAVVQIGRRTYSLQERINESREYHVGRVFTLATIKRKFPKAKGEVAGLTLVQLLEQKGLLRAVRSRNGCWNRLEARDIVIPHPLDQPKRRGEKQ